MFLHLSLLVLLLVRTQRKKFDLRWHIYLRHTLDTVFVLLGSNTCLVDIACNFFALIPIGNYRVCKVSSRVDLVHFDTLLDRTACTLITRFFLYVYRMFRF